MKRFDLLNPISLAVDRLPQFLTSMLITMEK